MPRSEDTFTSYTSLTGPGGIRVALVSEAGVGAGAVFGITTEAKP